MPKPPKAILLVTPVTPPHAFWPEGPCVVQVERVKIGWLKPRKGKKRGIYVYAYGVTGHSTNIEFDKSTIVPLDKHELRSIMRQWREAWQSSDWNFFLQVEGHHPASITPWTRKLVVYPATDRGWKAFQL